MMKKISDHSIVENKKPMKARFRVTRSGLAKPGTSDKSKSLALLTLKTKLTRAIADKKPASVIRRLREKIAFQRLSDASKFSRFRNAIDPNESAPKQRLSRAKMAAASKPAEPETSLPMLQVLPLVQIRSRRHFVPQAIVSEPVKTFADRESTRVIEDVDALDYFEGVAFALEGLPFTVMHYRGHPDATSTIYLPKEMSDVNEITTSIGKIIDRFGLTTSALIWQRRDDPDS